MDGTKTMQWPTRNRKIDAANLSMKSAPCSSFSEAILPLNKAVKNVSAAAAEAWPTAVLLTRVCLEVVKCTPPTLRCTICDEEE